MRDYFKIDLKKLKEEDRRFILNKASSEILFNSQGEMQNNSLLASIFAVFISIAALIIVSPFNSAYQKLIVIIVLSIFSIYLIVMRLKAHFFIKRQNDIMIRAYDELFKLHFKYAKDTKFTGELLR